MRRTLISGMGVVTTSGGAVSLMRTSLQSTRSRDAQAAS